ncbi:MAG: hypothetical protein M3Q65_05020 [Chloroflexota bacterium]|nr:hypothetical protein [Chloroflexota bacterium]
MREALKGRACDLMAATFAHGDKYNQDNHYRHPTATVGKARLVSRLQALLQPGRLELAKTPETDALAREQDYEIKIDQDANDRYGAFKVGTHDGLVTALGLCCVYQLPPSTVVRTYAGIEELTRSRYRYYCPGACREAGPVVTVATHKGEWWRSSGTTRSPTVRCCGRSCSLPGRRRRGSR